eukprot:gene24905-33397_t
MITFFAVQFPWFYLLWRRYRVNKTLNNEEKKEFVYMLAMLFYAIAAQLVNVIFGYPDSWLATGDNLLIGYIVAQVVCILLATVLLTRFMRKVVQMSEAILQLKREFVRYLDCAAVAILQAFAGRMDGFKFMLTNKNITLHIEDLAQVSEFYSPIENESELQDAVEESSVPALSSMSSSLSLVLFIDRFRVEQIIRNLMTNAVKFTPEGGDVTIRFLICSVDLQQQLLQHLDDLSPESVAGFSAESLAVTKSFLRIEVQDSGIGIAIEDQPQLFQQFAQFNRNALQGGGGSGLGLWICKNLSKFHGGRLGFHSEGTGKGSTFFVDLPIFSSKESSQLSALPLLNSPPADLDDTDDQRLQNPPDGSVGKDEDEEAGGIRNRAMCSTRRSYISLATQSNSLVFPEDTANQERSYFSTAVAAAATTAAARCRRMRLLIVDDSAMNRYKKSCLNVSSLRSTAM